MDFYAKKSNQVAASDRFRYDHVRKNIPFFAIVERSQCQLLAEKGHHHRKIGPLRKLTCE